MWGSNSDSFWEVSPCLWQYCITCPWTRVGVEELRIAGTNSALLQKGGHVTEKTALKKKLKTLHHSHAPAPVGPWATGVPETHQLETSNEEHKKKEEIEDQEGLPAFLWSRQHHTNCHLPTLGSSGGSQQALSRVTDIFRSLFPERYVDILPSFLHPILPSFVLVWLFLLPP